MKRVTRIITTAAIILAIIFLGTRVSTLNDPVVPPSDSSALAASRVAADRKIEKKVDALLARMNTKEKLQQVQLLSDGQITDADAKAGVGGVFSLTDPVKINRFQRLAVEKSRLGIPILFAYDTIHGYRTIFPVPLGAASSFDPKVAKTDAKIGARESATVGIKQIYSPMVDVSSEPRWGRIVEGNGEDPYLGSEMAIARVQGAQGDDYSEAQQDGDQRQALRRLRPARGRSRLQHHRHVRVPPAQHPPATVQGRRRGGVGHGDVLVQLAQRSPRVRQRAHRDRHPEEGVGLRRVHRE